MDSPTKTQRLDLFRAWWCGRLAAAFHARSMTFLKPSEGSSWWAFAEWSLLPKLNLWRASRIPLLSSCGHRARTVDVWCRLCGCKTEGDDGETVPWVSVLGLICANVTKSFEATAG